MTGLWAHAASANAAVVAKNMRITHGRGWHAGLLGLLEAVAHYDQGGSVADG